MYTPVTYPLKNFAETITLRAIGLYFQYLDDDWSWFMEDRSPLPDMKGRELNRFKYAPWRLFDVIFRRMFAAIMRPSLRKKLKNQSANKDLEDLKHVAGQDLEDLQHLAENMVQEWLQRKWIRHNSSDRNARLLRVTPDIYNHSIDDYRDLKMWVDN